MTTPWTPAEEQQARERLAAATVGPWWFDEDAYTWRLFGGCPDPSVPCHGRQLLKAPKRGTDYAEYWPSPQDGALIVNAWSDLTRALATIDAMRDALRWYADPAHWFQGVPGVEGPPTPYVNWVGDNGARARRVLGEEVGGE